MRRSSSARSSQSPRPRSAPWYYGRGRPSHRRTAKPSPPPKRPDPMPPVEGSILVTGSTDGLGRALARELAARGATVLLHGRSEARLDETLRELASATGAERLQTYRADLA